MTEGNAGVRASVGFASEKGPRKQNEDFAAAVVGADLLEPRREVVAAIADGVGGAKGGRVAAETAVRGFLDGFWDLPETMEVRRAAARVVNALNGWINALGRQDPELAGMACTFTALVLRGRVAHLVHLGDTRCYRLRRDHLTCLTADHVRERGPGQSRVLTRALGAEAEARLDYAAQPVALHDRFLLCSDGVHGVLTDDSIGEALRERSAPEVAARALVAAALDAGSADNCTALVLDVVGLPTAVSADVGGALMRLPLIPTPGVGETVDGYVLKALLSEGRYSRLFAAVDEVEGGEVALKFPKPQIAAVATHHAAFVREAWVGARVQSPWIGHVVELPPGRQTCLYTVMPLYQGELLETRLDAKSCNRSRGRAQHRPRARSRRRGAPSRRHHPSRHQARQHHPRRRGIVEAHRSRRGAGARMGRGAARGNPGRPRLCGAGNVRRRSRQRGDRHLRLGRHDVSRFHRRIPLREPGRSRRAAATGRRSLLCCAPICLRGWRPSSPARSRPILASGFTTSRNLRWKWRRDRRRRFRSAVRRLCWSAPRCSSGKESRRSSGLRSSCRCCGDADWVRQSEDFAEKPYGRPAPSNTIWSAHLRAASRCAAVRTVHAMTGRP